MESEIQQLDLLPFEGEYSEKINVSLNVFEHKINCHTIANFIAKNNKLTYFSLYIHYNGYIYHTIKIEIDIKNIIDALEHNYTMQEFYIKCGVHDSLSRKGTFQGLINNKVLQRVTVDVVHHFHGPCLEDILELVKSSQLEQIAIRMEPDDEILLSFIKALVINKHIRFLTIRIKQMNALLRYALNVLLSSNTNIEELYLAYNYDENTNNIFGFLKYNNSLKKIYYYPSSSFSSSSMKICARWIIENKRRIDYNFLSFGKGYIDNKTPVFKEQQCSSFTVNCKCYMCGLCHELLSAGEAMKHNKKLVEFNLQCELEFILPFQNILEANRIRE